MKNVWYLISTIYIFAIVYHHKYNNVNDEREICHEDRHTERFVELENDCVVHSLQHALRPLFCQSSHRVFETAIGRICTLDVVNAFCLLPYLDLHQKYVKYHEQVQCS